MGKTIEEIKTEKLFVLKAWEEKRKEKDLDAQAIRIINIEYGN